MFPSSEPGGGVWAWGRFGQMGKYIGEFLLEPAMQNNISGAGHPFHADLPGCGMKQSQHFGRTIPWIFMRIAFRVQLDVPIGARIGGCRIGSSFIHSPHRQPERFAQLIGTLNQRFFVSVCGSVTTTVPALRLRKTLPVSHQLRSFCQLHPASCKVLNIVSRLTVGSPSGARRNAR